MKPRLLAFAVVLGAMSSAFAAGETAAAPDENPMAGPPGGPWRRLFLDAMVVEQQHGLKRVFHAAEKHPANPVLKHDRPWEGGPTRGGPYLYGTVMSDGGKLRMWYHCYQGGYRNCYAESTDGLNWTKPNLGLCEFQGSTENNLFLTVSQDADEPPPFKNAGQCHNPSVIKRPWESDPSRRYALFCYGVDYRHARVAFSPDGLRWTFVPETRKKGLFSSGDVLNFFHDPYNRRYVATFKSGNRRGRAAGVATSADGLNWSKPVAGPVMVADDLDPDATQIYGMPVFPYQGLYVGLPWIYNARWFKHGSYSDQRMAEVERDSPCTMDVQLAWSWDLINWTRPPVRAPLIPRGRAGEFDSQMIYTARAPVVVDGRLYFYYGGWDGPHNSPTPKANIGLAVLRLDGFCSMHAGAEEGSLVTRRELFRIPRVTINAAVKPGGYVIAEILDTENNPLPGFGREDCISFTGDATAHVLTWKTDRLPEESLDVDKKLRFHLKQADLYSYLPDQATGPVTVSYDPGVNGGLLPSDPKIPASQRFVMGGLASGYRIVEEDGLVCLELHSVADRKTRASFHGDANWDDQTDWCLEMWARVADPGSEPNYGLASFFRPNAGRGAALYLSAKAAGIMSSENQTTHKVLKSVPVATTERIRWYRMVHTGGADGEVSLEIDGREVIRMPFRELFPRLGRGANVTFGPNAAHCDGRMIVACFGYRLGSTDVLFGPVAKPAGSVKR